MNQRAERQRVELTAPWSVAISCYKLDSTERQRVELTAPWRVVISCYELDSTETDSRTDGALKSCDFLL